MNAQKQAQVYNINKCTFFHLGNRIICAMQTNFEILIFQISRYFFIHTSELNIAKNALLCLRNMAKH